MPEMLEVTLNFDTDAGRSLINILEEAKESIEMTKEEKEIVEKIIDTVQETIDDA